MDFFLSICLTFILYIYVFCTVVLFLFSCMQLTLLMYYHTKKQTQATTQFAHKPLITIQLPIYNERYVVERLIDAILKIDYPKDHLEIQILDDSTDDTSDIISKKIKNYQLQNFNILHIRRTNRAGFKAGALAHGLQSAKGDYIAIFDADFVPNPDFLSETLPYFSGPNIGLVQSRWGHLNVNYSLLTRLQAIGLDGHFRIEQGGRTAGRCFINFNGTAGVWRKSCITDAGGWSADTLAEDFDLSYRAQLKGWKLVYLENYETPAELPMSLSAIRSQQYRWMKGGAECAKKNIFNVLKNSTLNIKTKIHAIFHLLNSTTFIFAFILALSSVPVAWLAVNRPDFKNLFGYMQLLQIGWVVLVLFYRKATQQRLPFIEFCYQLPLFLALMGGLSFHNAVAVMQGYLGYKTPFVRTPKWGNSTVNQYISEKKSWLPFFEITWLLYFVGALVLDVFWQNIGLVFYHLLLVIGYSMVVFMGFRSK
jgi:cellulose synthase/poly-beta-1,6-N-acetylglucosamine synthase-like glycosyltransferase